MVIVAPPPWYVPKPPGAIDHSLPGIELRGTLHSRFDWEHSTLTIKYDEEVESPPAEDNVHRAAKRPCPSAQELARDPPEPAWLDSDGVKLSDDKRTATHGFDGTERTSVLSADWVHVKHACTVRTWRVSAPRQTHLYGDIFFGVTEAVDFSVPGACVAFDGRGNFRAGYHPLNLTHLVRASKIPCTLEGVSGSLDAERNETLEVIADLGAQTLTVRQLASENAIVYPLPGWQHARLIVSFSEQGDSVRMEK